MDVIKIDDILETGIFKCHRCKDFLADLELYVNISNHELSFYCHPCQKACEKTKDCVQIKKTVLYQLREKLSFPCVYKKQGCPKRVSYNGFKAHIDDCIYALFPCYYCNEWEGTVPRLPNHFKNEHSSFFITSDPDFQDNFTITPQVLMETKKNKTVTFFLSTSRGIILGSFETDDKDHKIYIDWRPFFVADLDFDEVHIEIFKENQIVIQMLTALEKVYYVENLEQNISATTVVRVVIPSLTNASICNKMLDTLECLECKELMRAPIHQCTTGHSICNSCLPNVTKCSICDDSYKGTRNYSLEAMIDEIGRPCKYETEGCRVRGKNVEDHEDICLFRTYHCPVVNCNDRSTINGFHDIIHHMVLKHEDITISGPCLDCSSLKGSRYYLICFRNIFFIENPQDPVHVVAQIHGESSENESKNFSLEISISSVYKETKEIGNKAANNLEENCIKTTSIIRIIKKTDIS